MTIQAEHSPFPADETLAAYIDGTLDEKTRREVAEHVAECADCRDVLVAAGEFSAPRVVRGVTWSRNTSIGLAAAAAVAFAIFLTPLRDRVWPRDDIGRLAAVAPAERPFDGRLSGFPHRERAAIYRGGPEEKPAPDDYKFLAVAAEVEERAAEHPDARTLHAAGIAHLVDDKTANAVKNLENAVREEKSPDASLLNDLAAAYLANGNYADGARTAERAWQLAQTPEIAWNRALAAEHTEPPAAAIAKWKKYLELEPSSPWTAEAKKHIADLQEIR